MHQAVLLGPPENLICLLLADEPVLAVPGEADGIVVDIHAHIFFQVAAALAHQAAGTAAGARAHGDGGGPLNNGSHLVIGGRVAVVLDGAHNGHHPHEVDAAAQHRGQHPHADAGVLFKALAQIGVFFALLPVAEDALHNAGDPDGVVIKRLSVVIADADHAGPDQLAALLLGKFHAFFRFFGQVLNGEVLFKTHPHHDGAHIVVDDGVKDPVFGVFVGDAGVGQALEAYFGSQGQDVGSAAHMRFLLYRSDLFTIGVWRCMIPPL